MIINGLVVFTLLLGTVLLSSSTSTETSHSDPIQFQWVKQRKNEFDSDSYERFTMVSSGNGSADKSSFSPSDYSSSSIDFVEVKTGTPWKLFKKLAFRFVMTVLLVGAASVMVMVSWQLGSGNDVQSWYSRSVYILGIQANGLTLLIGAILSALVCIVSFVHFK